MAKINLLTLHYSPNNGSFLQSYCTCEILKECGHDVTIINLQKKSTVLGKYKSLRTYLYLPRYFKFWFYRKLKFSAKETRLMFDINKQYIPKADYTIVGSDQVWNMDLIKRKNLPFFLDFVDDNSKKISLSSSFGKKDWECNNDLTQKVKKLLSQFDAISVREESGIDICRDAFNVSATCIVDPTLAYGDFSKLIKFKAEKQEVGCFIFKHQGYAFDVIDFIANKEKLGVRVLNNIGRKGYKYNSFWKQSPIEWLQAIQQSKIFVSDSFHGVACSIILNKQFVAVCADEKKFERIRSMLTIFGLTDKIVMSLNELKERYDEVLTPIDYEKVNAIKVEKQREFYDFIKKNIQ